MTAPGRAGDGRPPSAFGRPAVTEEPPADAALPGFQVVVHAQVLPTPESLAQMHEVIKETTRSAILDGYAAAFAEIEAAAAEEDVAGGEETAGPAT